MNRKDGFRVVELGRAAAMLFVIFTIVGCASNSNLGRDGLPSKKYLVGGGFSINWIAPQAGIAYLVEETTGKILMTKSLQADEVFDIELPSAPEEAKEFLGIEMADVKLSLYFIPSAQKKASQ